MASRAFAAVARAVLFVMKDPDDESLRLLGQPKNYLGQTDSRSKATASDDATAALGELVAALQTRDQQLGLVIAEENVA